MQATRAKNFEVKIANGAIAPAVLISSRELTPAQKIIWLTIRNFEGKKDVAWPSLTMIAKTSGLDKKTILDGLHGRERHVTTKDKGKPTEREFVRHARSGLVELGWIRLNKHTSKSTGNTHNTYECWIPVESDHASGSLTTTPVESDHHPSGETGAVTNTRNQYKEPTQELNTLAPSSTDAGCQPSGDTDVTTADDAGRSMRTTDKSRDHADVVAVIGAFKNTVNPTINFGQTTYRKDALAMVKQFGLEETLRMIEVIASKQGEPYFPVIVNPSQLRAKWPTVAVNLKKNAPKKWTVIHEDGSVTYE